MVNKFLYKLLEDNRAGRDFKSEISEEYRKPVIEDLNKHLSIKPNYRYGGSLAKGTAISGSSDLDLLCYFDFSYEKSVENIYEDLLKIIQSEGYKYRAKNSAIYVYGKRGEENWDTTIDVVPGKFTSNESDKDVYLWCNKDKCRLKSNPEIQIGKVKEFEDKDLIKIIKIFRKLNNLRFKSFYLEIFTIDVVSKTFTKDDTLYDKLIKFCRCADQIGVTKIYDPANESNNIMEIHSKEEFAFIRKKFKRLLVALETNDVETIKKCFYNQKFDADEGYYNNAKSHSKWLNKDLFYFPLEIKAYYKSNDNWNEFDDEYVLDKNTDLLFKITHKNGLEIKNVQLIVSNAGYEANKVPCLRGESVACNYSKEFKAYTRGETAAYRGVHFIQPIAEGLSSTQKIYGKVRKIRIR